MSKRVIEFLIELINILFTFAIVITYLGGCLVFIYANKEYINRLPSMMLFVFPIGIGVGAYKLATTRWFGQS